ncbi:probable protein phosphatase 2C 39 isoform X1 [Vigna angularis]|nr:probable protein phosphatase 2C 39 isoform X1 [Vigna angularis]
MTNNLVSVHLSVLIFVYQFSGLLFINPEKVLGPSDSDSGKGKSKMKKHITHGFHLVKGRSGHAMEDYVVAQFKQVDNNELGLFAIFDGHSGQSVPDYLRTHLFDNILKEPNFWTEPADAVKRAYSITDSTILDKSGELGRGGSTAVTAILINCQKLVVANIGDSRAVLCQNGQAKQLSVDHEPSVESEDIKNRGGFVSNFPGDVPRVDGQLAVSRAFGDKSLKVHLSSEPHVIVELIGDDAEFVILASDGLWKVMTNQEAVDAIRDVKDARSAAKILTEEARNRKSSDDISCVVVKFQ